MSRRPAALAVFLLAFAGALPAAAQTPALVKEDFLFRVQRRDGAGYTDLIAAERARYFNLAKCECKIEIRIRAEPAVNAAAKMTQIAAMSGPGIIRMMIGPNCADADPRQRADCVQLGPDLTFVEFASRGLIADRTVKQIASPMTMKCDPVRREQKIWLLVDARSDSMPDLLRDAAPVESVIVDNEPPPAPSVREVTGGHEALAVSWAGLPPDVADLDGYQIFCSRAEHQVFADGTFDDLQMETPASLCGAPAAAVSTRTAAVLDRGTPFPAFGDLKNLDPRFACSDHLPATQTSTRISILQNGIPYLVGVASVDRHGNTSPLTAVYLQRPVPTKSFYLGYRECPDAGPGECRDSNPDRGQALGGCALGRPRARDAVGQGGVAAAFVVLATVFALGRTRRGSA